MCLVEKYIKTCVCFENEREFIFMDCLKNDQTWFAVCAIKKKRKKTNSKSMISASKMKFGIARKGCWMQPFDLFNDWLEFYRYAIARLSCDLVEWTLAGVFFFSFLLLAVHSGKKVRDHHSLDGCPGPEEVC
uniref:Uncharacterized protein n=1 Tax=Anguilla anguilla TaxID=7936 RepID=A0A0E9WK59_ANGAN